MARASWLRAVTVALLGPAAISIARAQCAMCGTAAGSSPGVARGLATSIFFLLGVLALVVAWLVALVLRARSGRRPGVAPAAREADDRPVLPGAPLPTGHAPAEK